MARLPERLTLNHFHALARQALSEGSADGGGGGNELGNRLARHPLRIRGRRGI